MKKQISLMAAVSTALLVAAMPASSAAFDEEMAKATIKRNDCTKCHAIEKTKKGPPYKKVAEKFRGKPDAEVEKKLMDNLTKEPMVKLEDGTEEKHKKIDTTDAKELKNLMNYIRSL